MFCHVVSLHSKLNLSGQRMWSFLQMLVLHLASMPSSSCFPLITVPGTLLLTDPLHGYHISHSISSTTHKQLVSEAESPCLAVFSKVQICFIWRACIQNSLIFASQETPLSRKYPLHFSGEVVPALSSSQSPWSSVIALHDDASELDKAICVFCFAVFYFSAFAVWCFSLEEVCAMLYASNCGKILQP